MHDESIVSMAEALGKPLADITVAFLAIVNALRKQPGFDDAAFCAEIQALMSRADVSEMQRSLLGVAA